MRTCVICGALYAKEQSTCPYCGCPADRYTFESFGYPQNLAASYTLVGVKDTGGRVPALLMEDPATKERLYAARIPEGEGEEFFLHKLDAQRKQRYRELPEVYGIYPEEGYYLYEEITGQTIQDLLEHENPLDPQSAGHIMNELNLTFTALKAAGFRYGLISPFSCCITKEGIRLTDFGSDKEYVDDENSMERMGFRLLNGRWPLPEETSYLPAYAPDEMAKGIAASEDEITRPLDWDREPGDDVPGEIYAPSQREGDAPRAAAAAASPRAMAQKGASLAPKQTNKKRLIVLIAAAAVVLIAAAVLVITHFGKSGGSGENPPAIEQNTTPAEQGTDTKADTKMEAEIPAIIIDDETSSNEKGASESGTEEESILDNGDDNDNR